MTAVQRVVSEEGADRKMPPGVLLEGPVVDAKFLDSYIAFGIMVTGSIAALVWAFTQGIGWIEISVFVGTALCAFANPTAPRVPLSGVNPRDS